MNHAEETQGRPALAYSLFLCAVTLLVYVAAVRFPFIRFDDMMYVVENASAHHWSSALSSFFPAFISDPFQTQANVIPNFYRPIVGFWVVFNYKIFGVHAALWRIEILALYCLCVWLCRRVAYALTGNEFASFAAALLFALHPLHVEGVAWLSGAFVELLLCSFFLGGFLSYLQWRKTGRSSWLMRCAALVMLALLSKETGAALPILIVAHAWIFRNREEAARSVRLWPVAAAAFVPVSLYALLRFLAIHGVVASKLRHNWGEALRSAPLFFSIYLKHAIWPFHLANWYGTQIVTGLTLREFYLPLILCLAYLGFMLWALTRKPLVGFLLLWWVVPLSIALVGVINFPEDEFIHDRFTFVALAGFCILAGSLLDRLPAANQKLFGFPVFSAAALAGLTAILGVASALQVFTWRSDLTMAAHAVEVSPTAVRPRILLGVALHREHDKAAALALYRDTINMAPDRWDAIFAYGTELANNGDRNAAFQVLSHGLEVAPKKSPFYLIMADMLANAGYYDKAVKLLENGIPIAEQPDLLRSKLANIEARRRGAAH
jgi:protein O-mannosyl-transferase